VVKLVCRACSNPLKIISGGLKTTVGSTQVTMVHVFGCLNDDCPEKMVEQNRIETPQDSFTG